MALRPSPADQTPRPPCLRGLAKDQGDIKGLQGSLEGFNRLRIGGLRVIYRQISGTEILLAYANTRDTIYEQILENRKT